MLNSRAASVSLEYHGSRGGVIMVVVPMSVKSWNWNEVKSEELNGLSVALVGPSPWDPEQLQASNAW
jgi:hypothetical protein